MNWLHPDLLPESADPVGSTRHENVDIIYVRVPWCKEHRAFHYDEENKLFIITDCSPHNKLSRTSFKGTVLEETNGSYSWWQSIRQGE